ncbi:MAG: hypothetical protein ACJAUH_002462 [Saprospiraceae bacterium]|jgi:hypothetical protein
MKKVFLPFLVLLFVSGCASNYYPINLSALPSDRQGEINGINYGYSKNVLSKTGNKKYAKKEVKRGINVISVKIKNNTDYEISVKDDLIFRMGNKELEPLESVVVTDNIRQPAPLYALYGLLFLNITRNNQGVSLPIGVPIAIGNIAVASSANRKFREDFSIYNIRNEKIAPGETLSGLVAFRDNASGTLVITRS